MDPLKLQKQDYDNYLNWVSIHGILNTALMQRRVLLVDIRNHLNPVFDQIFVVKNIIWNRSVND